ncbi:GntR family transcriptional regulator [Burkholderia cenocepacia]|uniref:GntR family transcriptional regulator n=1 Tax=Burkholderia cenocepacia TaxID=95486 RepID=UPI0028618535|nr:GntR family transcriptional regulator [Burkholderia cenocepacia]MDR5644436.1 GntR family transcriptional regulator [Burkholderia cenocepacia]
MSSSKPPLHEHLVAILRQRIVDGVLPSGSPVSEREICAEFGVSRTPLREALKVLASEGLVCLLRNRGAVVAIISLQTIEEKLAIAASLETYAVRKLCARGTDGELDQLSKFRSSISGRLQDIEPRDHFDLYRTIRLELIRLAGNSTLSHFYPIVFEHLHRAHTISLTYHPQPEMLIDDYLAVAQSVVARNSLEAETRIAEAVRRVTDTVRKHLRSR